MNLYQCFLLTEPEHDDRKRMGMKVNTTVNELFTT